MTIQPGGAPARPQRPAQGFAILGHDLLAHGGAQTLGPAHEALQKRLGIQRRKEAVESVVAGNALGQFEKSFEPVMLGLAKILHVIEAFAPAEQRADGDDEQIDQPVIPGALDARVGQILKMNDQTEFRMRTHPVSFRQCAKKYQSISIQEI